MRAYQKHPGAQPKLGVPLGESNMRLPCGTCLGCRAAHATQWAHRAEHEATSWANNSFVTLTYDDDNLPAEGHLDARALTLFVKRLRKRAARDRETIRRDSSAGIRYFACGEYGEQNERPHYHLLLFNAGFTGYRVGKDLYESPVLAELWPHGKHTWQQAEPGAAGNYIAKYQLKQQTSHLKREWRRAFVCDIATHAHITKDGELLTPPPFLRMSLKPAIGQKWLDRWKDDLQHGYLINNGRKHSIPRTYKEKLAGKELRYLGPAWPEKGVWTEEQELAAHIMDKARTHQLTSTKEDNNNPARRKAAEQIHKRQKELTERRNL